MRRLSLNVFQRIFRSWERVHPYNAAQAMRIEGDVSHADACKAWVAALDAMGLGPVHIDGRFCVHGEPAGEAAAASFRSLSEYDSLDDHLSHELNVPFSDVEGLPFQAFLLPQHGSHWLGIVYRHWVADGVSIRRLMREWFVRLHDPLEARRRPVRRASSGYWRVFADQGGGLRTDEAVLNVLRSHDRFRRVRKPHEPMAPDPAVRVITRSVDDLIEPLRASCRSSGTRVSDVFLASLVEACHGHVPLQVRPGRRDVAVGSVIDLRPHAVPRVGDEVFGMFLGFTSVVCRPCELCDWPELLKSVQRQTSLHRRQGMARVATAWMPALLTISRLVPKERLYHFYRKEMPTAGGLSNVPMDRTWAGRYTPRPLLDYVRASPTGPTAPVALATTTLHGRLHFSLSYRPALVSAQGAQGLLSCYLRRLNQVATDGVADFASRR